MEEPLGSAAFVSTALWVAAGVLFACAAVSAAARHDFVTLADGRRQERRLPLALRLMMPLVPWASRFFGGGGALASRMRERTGASLVAAGFDDLLSPQEFLALRVLPPLCALPFWIAASVGAAKAVSPSSWPQFATLFSVSGLLALWAWPAAWLRRQGLKRHSAIQRALPFTLDLMTLSVEAGLDFMAALRRTTERPVADPLSEELMRVVRATQLGSTRKEALRALAVRVPIPDVRAVVSALVQADELGVSLGSILRIQADQARTRRFERAEKLANEAPVKLLAPLVVFIFPAVFLVLLGPVLYRVAGNL
ncbi:MAG: type II secretion system F family protein [Kiritimatiellae bacterium]|nr:type II secretion system F family protein [Kiritimatiellia bacterium]